MIDTLNQLKTIALTALFNPTFLVLLLILFLLESSLVNSPNA